MNRLRPYRVWLPVALLIAIGLAGIASAGDAARFARQLVWVAGGAALAAIVVVIGVNNLLKYTWALYASSIATLVLVLFTRPVNNARAWFDLGLFKVQPSELFRPVLLLVLARFLGTRVENELIPRPGRLRRDLEKFAAAFLFAALPAALVWLEPDVGLVIALLLLTAVVVFASGISWQLAVGGVITAAAGLAVVYAWALDPSQKMRILAWLDPAAHAKGAAWQLMRSQLAIGAGGFWGKGFGLGEMNRFGLVPVNDSDFILSVVAEELGFVTVMILVVLYVWILWECVSAARGGFDALRSTWDAAPALVAIGVGGYVAGEAALNIGVSAGLLPTTGVTLPFVSYGGSSMVANMVMVALVVSVALSARGGKGGSNVL